MSTLDFAYHMRDHTPKWLMRLNLIVSLALVIPMLAQRWPAWAAFFSLVAFNWIVGFRSYKRRKDANRS